WEVIANAGGFTTDANQEHVLIIHNDNNSVAQTKIIELNLDDMFSNGVNGRTTYVNAGDIVYITETKLASFEKFMSRFTNIIAPFISLERGIIMGKEAYDVLTNQTTRDVVVY
ncbi:hypothetical protein KAI46_02005, partial [bacterium]|nr:hypothetical protein [bacterium]